MFQITYTFVKSLKKIKGIYLALCAGTVKSILLLILSTWILYKYFYARLVLIVRKISSMIQYIPYNLFLCIYSTEIGLKWASLNAKCIQSTFLHGICTPYLLWFLCRLKMVSLVLST